jgi:DNA polymerase IIIc chi subunit
MKESQIIFYQSSDGIIKSMAPILLKIIDEKKRAFIYVKNKEKIEEIDILLWNYGRSKFIPHATILDENFIHEDQPILISNQEFNLNQADYLIFIDEPQIEFTKNFFKCFYFYENENECNLIKADVIFKKHQGKWVKC